MDGLVGDVFGRPEGILRTWDGKGLRVDFPYSREKVWQWVLRALGRMKNRSAPGPTGIGYRLIKAVRDTMLGRELVDEVVDNLLAGVIPTALREIRVVFIPKPVHDLTLTKSWRPLNLINYVGKLGEKVVADRIQDFGGELFHHLQFGSVRVRSVVDVLYRSVVRVRRCLYVGGGVGWWFWDVKGGFQNVVGCEVLRCLDGVEGTRGVCRWVREFVSPQSFEVSWDGSVQGSGRLVMGVPQGSLLSPVLFLVWLAPILIEMEQRIREEVPGIGVEFPSYVDNLHCRLYDERGPCRRMEEVEGREQM